MVCCIAHSMNCMSLPTHDFLPSHQLGITGTWALDIADGSICDMTTTAVTSESVWVKYVVAASPLSPKYTTRPRCRMNTLRLVADVCYDPRHAGADIAQRARRGKRAEVVLVRWLKWLEEAHLSKSSNVRGEGLWMVAHMVMPVVVKLCSRAGPHVMTASNCCNHDITFKQISY